MKNTAPIGLGILVVAGLFGFVGGAVSYVMYDWSFLGALVLAVIIAIIVAIILMFGWREPASPPKGAGTAGVGAGSAPTASPSSDRTSAPAADATSSAQDEAPAAPVTAETTDEADQPEATAVEAQPTTSTPAATVERADGVKVKSATTLPGEDELASRKGNWKYQGEAKATRTAAPAKAAPADTFSDKDYDGDGTVEGTDQGSKPELLTAAREGGADNLKEIKGVGPKMEGMLNDMGVYHFDQVAGWSADEVAWVDANLKGFKGRVSRDNWVDQAKILASGGETEFSKKVEKGGVY